MRRLILLVSLGLAGSPALAQPALLSASPVADADLTPRQAEILRLLRAERGVSDVQIVVANVGLLGRAPDVTVPLPDRPAVAIQGFAEVSPEAGLTSWTGRVEAGQRGRPARAQAAFVVRGGWLTGTLRDGEAVYTIRPLTGGLHAIARVDTDQKPTHDDDYSQFERQERERIEREATSERVGTSAPRAARVDPVVDILIVYTAEVAAAYADPVAFAQLVVAGANSTYANTGLGLRLSLVSAYQTPTAAGADMSIDLPALKNRDDGRFDEVHALRDAYGADVVSMIGPSSWGGCGRGYVKSNEATAFTTIASDCASSGITLAHEVGHNFGSGHDPYQNRKSDSTPAYAYGQGAVNVAGRWRTVMSYNTECSDAGVSCTNVGYWSDPATVYTDTTEPIVVAPTGNAAESDNARLIRERGSIVEAFRVRPPAARVAVSPARVAADAEPGRTVTRQLSIRNGAAAGAAPLDWSVVLTGAGADAAEECADGTSLEQNTNTYYTTSRVGEANYGQSFTVGCTGRLRSVAPAVYASSGTGGAWTATLRLYRGAGTGGAVVATQPFAYTTPTEGGVFFVPIVLDAPVAVVKGEVYTWFLELTSGGVALLYSVDDPYAGGVLYRTANGTAASASARSERDMRFQATFDAPPRWLSVGTRAGSILAGGASVLPLTADATGLAEGTHTLNAVITTSDPSAPTVTVPVTLQVQRLAATDAEVTPGTQVWLDAPRPNPTPGQARIPYGLAAAAPIRLTVVDVLGREVAVLADGLHPAGPASAALAAGRLAAGVYVIRLEAPGLVLARQLVVVR